MFVFFDFVMMPFRIGPITFFEERNFVIIRFVKRYLSKLAQIKIFCREEGVEGVHGAQRTPNLLDNLAMGRSDQSP